MAKKIKSRLTEIKNLIDIDKLCKKYKLSEDDVNEKIEFYFDDELQFQSDLEDDFLVELIERDFRIEMRGHEISDSVPCKFKVLAVKQPFDYGERRIKDLKKLYSLDPKKSMTNGIGDAACDKDGNIIYKESGKSFNKGPYPEHKYVYPVILIFKRLDVKNAKFRNVTIRIFEDEVEIRNLLEVDKWYTGKITFDEYEDENYDLSGNFAKITEFEEIESEDIILVDISSYKDKSGKRKNRRKGFIFDKTLGNHFLELKDSEEYFKTFQVNGRMPNEKFVCVIADVLKYSGSGVGFYIDDGSINVKETPVIVFDNRANQERKIGERSKILVIGDIQVDLKSKRVQITASELKLIPPERGGHYYPERFVKSKKLKVKTKKKTEATKTKPKKVTKKLEEEETEEEEPIEEIEEEEETEEEEELFFDKDLISSEIQDKIVDAIYKLNEEASFETVLKESGLKRNEAYDSSFTDLINREILTKTKRGYKI